MKLTWSQLKTFRMCYHTYWLRMYGTSAEYPQITVPQKMIDRMQKIKTKQALHQAEKKKKTNFNSPAVISGKRQEYNHCLGQAFNEFEVKKLSSHGWKHYKSKGDYFTIKAHKKNPALQDVYGSVEMFDDLGLDDSIINVIKNQGISTPTKIQSLVIPKMLQGYNTICAAETGSGKTFAYLLPILHNILREGSSLEEEGRLQHNAPKAIILVPSHELVHQLTVVLEPFTEELPLSVMSTDNRNLKMADGTVDILITTPGKLSSLLKKRYVKTNNLSFFVLDEADSLLDDSFSGFITKIVHQLEIGKSDPTEHAKYVSEGVQVGLASATYPRGLDTILEPVLSLENFEVVTTEHLHHLMPHVPQKFMRCGPTDKLMETVKLLKMSVGKPTLVFCNKTQTAYWLSKSLEELDINTVMLTGFDDHKDRLKYLRSFYDGECDVLVCTDIASRGLDTQCVHHVINYDFPLYMSDYIHRAGRVGRVGSHIDCRVTSFVTYSWNVDLLWKIETAARKQKELHNVNANIKRKFTGIIETKYGDMEE